MRTTAQAPVIELHDAQIEAQRGTVFGPLTAASHRTVTVVLGATGSGRTSVLLSIAGRMRLSDGTLSTMGDTGLAQMRKRVGIVGFAEIDALEPAVTLGDTLRERLSWSMPWYSRTPPMTAELAAELLNTAFGDIPMPSHQTLVRELSSVEHMLVRVALALIDGPEMLVIDDFDALRDPADRELLAKRLSVLAARDIAIVLATSDPSDAALYEVNDPAVIAL